MSYSHILPFLKGMMEMARISRKCNDGKYFHVMIQGHNKNYIFKCEKLKEKMKEIIYNKRKGLNIMIIAFCIMDNHVHLLVKVNKIEDLSKYMSRVNTSYAKYYNYYNNKVGYVFRDRYRAEGIYSINQMINCVKYIHENPVKAHIVSKAQEYKYSSIQDYEKNNIEQDVIVELFGNDIDYLEKICGIYENYDFIEEDDEFGEGKKEKFEEVCKEYRNLDYKNEGNVYKTSNILKKRCAATNEEIYRFMGLKRATYYNIIKKAKKLDF